ncbi:MAG: hypothetical protein M1832_001014 [Thelocarpon impressellum]|nr:MAG: hypothetical protein M1832_001014 [Thelocarpon impressellum]
MPAASTPSSASADAARAGKNGKRSLVVTLRLSSDLLTAFEEKPAGSRKGASRSKSSTASGSTPAPLATEESLDAVSESNSTPAPGGTPNGLTPVPGDATKRKGVPGPKPGSKRGGAALADGVPKARGRPGPKKKMKLDDGAVDNGDGTTTSKGPSNTAAPLGGHKLGPKANQGAINAGLRALDRSGKPCRKWEKKGFKIKSFTGITWDVPTWKAPRPVVAEVTAGSDAVGSSATLPATDSDGKENKGSSAVDSEKSNSGGDVDVAAAASVGASSPPLAVATPA